MEGASPLLQKSSFDADRPLQASFGNPPGKCVEESGLAGAARPEDRRNPAAESLPGDVIEQVPELEALAGEVRRLLADQHRRSAATVLPPYVRCVEEALEALFPLCPPSGHLGVSPGGRLAANPLSPVGRHLAGPPAGGCVAGRPPHSRFMAVVVMLLLHCCA